jgi:thioredoxin reductase (NADPH)
VERFRTQAGRFGLKILTEDIRAIDAGRRNHWIVSGRDSAYEALSVILATGANLASPGEAGRGAFAREGVSYCATCDGPFTGIEMSS